jgi:hypothetical protein
MLIIMKNETLAHETFRPAAWAPFFNFIFLLFHFAVFVVAIFGGPRLRWYIAWIGLVVHRVT